MQVLSKLKSSNFSCSRCLPRKKNVDSFSITQTCWRRLLNVSKLFFSSLIPPIARFFSFEIFMTLRQSIHNCQKLWKLQIYFASTGAHFGRFYPAFSHSSAVGFCITLISDWQRILKPWNKEAIYSEASLMNSISKTVIRGKSRNDYMIFAHMLTWRHARKISLLY